MRISWLALLVGLAISISSSINAAQQEVLDSLIDLAIKNNPELSAATHYQQSTAEAARGAGALPDPMLSVGAMNLPHNSLSLGETPMSSIAVGLTQKIPWPGKLSARSDLAMTRYRESEADQQIVRNRIAREVTDAYLNYSYWTESIDIFKQYQDLLKGTRDITEVRYSNGKAQAQDVLRAGSMLSRIEIRLLQANQKRYASLLKLQQAVGDTTISDTLPAELAAPETGPDDQLSFDSSPLLTRAATVVEQARTKQRLARAEYWPDFTVGVDYSFRKNVVGDPVHGTDFLTFKLGVNLPLWFFAKQKHQTRSASLMVLSSQQRERSVHDMLSTRFNDAASNLAVIRESLDKYDKALIPEATAAMEAAEVAYENGEVDFNALLSAQSDMYDIRLERLNLLNQYHQTKAALAELAGTTIERK